MQHKINQDFGRIGLHDSNQLIKEYNSDRIVIDLDWGFLHNYTEGGIPEAIVIGPCILTFYEIISSTFINCIDDNTKEIVDKPINFDDEYELILECTNNEYPTYNIFTIECCANQWDEGDPYWIIWDIKYKRAEFIWDEFILHKNWLNGTEALK